MVRQRMPKRQQADRTPYLFLHFRRPIQCHIDGRRRCALSHDAGQEALAVLAGRVIDAFDFEERTRRAGLEFCSTIIDADRHQLLAREVKQLMATSVNNSGIEFQVSDSRPLFEIEGINYAPSKDGQRFLTSVVTERAPTPPINVALNWTAEVKK